MGVAGGDDLDAITVLEHRAQRHQLMVDLDGDAAIAHVGVHRIGEVHRGGVARQRQYPTLGREDIHLVGEQIDLDMLEKLGRIAAGALDVEQGLQPFVRALLHLGQRSVGGLVKPVRSHAGLGDMVHLTRADLHLRRRAIGADQRGVQRLVTVHLGNGDVVLELARHRFVQAVQHAQREITRGHILDDDAKTVDIEHLRKRQVLLGHFLINRIQVLLAARHLRLKPRLGQAGANRLEDFVHHLAPVAARRLGRLGEDAVAQRINMRERELLHFAVQRIQAQAVGDGRVNLQRLARDTAALGRRHRAQGAHVVQAVSQLDQDDANIARHGQQHLAEILGLRVGLGLELDAIELGNTIDKLGDRFTKTRANVLGGDRGVLDHVVQQRRHQRLRIELPVGQDFRHRQRMRNIRFAAGALLPLVGGVTELVGLFNTADIGRLEVAREMLPEVGGERVHGQPLPVCAKRAPLGSGAQFDRSQWNKNKWHSQISTDPCSGKVGAVKHFQADLACGDFAQRDHGRLVAIGFHQRRATLCQLARAIGRSEGQLKTVVNIFHAVVYGNACHGESLSKTTE